jgi:hypothetical protein
MTCGEVRLRSWSVSQTMPEYEWPFVLTEPMDMKKPNVAAEESMYCDKVANAPRGPGPPLT